MQTTCFSTELEFNAKTNDNETSCLVFYKTNRKTLKFEWNKWLQCKKVINLNQARIGFKEMLYKN